MIILIRNCHYCDKVNVIVKQIDYYFGVINLIPTHNTIKFNICAGCYSKEKKEMELLKAKESNE